MINLYQYFLIPTYFPTRTLDFFKATAKIYLIIDIIYIYYNHYINMI